MSKGNANVLRAAAETPALDRYLDFSARLTKQSASISALKTEIEKAQKAEQAAVAATPSLAPLDQKLEDIAADLALNNISDKPAEDRRAGVAKERLALEEKIRWASANVGAIRRTLAGLNRRLSDAEAEIASITAQTPSLLTDVLREQAASIGAEYMRHAQHVRDAYLRLLAVASMLDGYGLPGAKISYSTCWEFFLPSFRVEGLENHDRYHFDQLFGADKHKFTDTRKQAFDAERQRLLELGVKHLT